MTWPYNYQTYWKFCVYSFCQLHGATLPAVQLVLIAAVFTIALQTKLQSAQKKTLLELPLIYLVAIIVMSYLLVNVLNY